ncbi:hypothetical protein BDN72DRAFT_862422 [Pluteus cervinus]|uniref:Uncharacterized protein n=1 Tax=Pluteus cervinus TaxID=181527 RepID=A0ACD3ABW1_9AGAR|nr:hypothetical protein BDN72DRAFT_862422 [Pluteus cervinus]
MSHSKRESISSLSDLEAREAAEILLSIRTRVENSGFSTYAEFERIKAIADEAISAFEQFQDYCEHHKAAECKILALSSVTDNDKTRLGYQSIVVDRTATAIMGLPPLDPADWKIDGIFSTLSTLRKFIGVVVEAGSRVIIDFILIRFIVRLLPEEEVLFVLPELILSKSSGGRIAYVHTIDGEKEYITGLVGFTDYVVHYIPKADTELKASSVKIGYRDLDTLQGALDEESVLLLIEAKSVQDRLEGHLPQAIAECLAALGIIQQAQANSAGDESNSIYQGFVLTNGPQWIFGVVEQRSIRSNKDDRLCYHTSMIDIDEGGVQQFGSMMQILNYWVRR